MIIASTKYDFENKKKHKKPTRFRYVKMVGVDNLKDGTIEREVKANISYESVVKTDNYTSYNKIKDNVWSHKAQTVKPKIQAMSCLVCIR